MRIGRVGLAVALLVGTIGCTTGAKPGAASPLPAESKPREVAAPPAASTAAKAEAPAEGDTVPLEMKAGRLFVQATINGQGPFRVLVDTGYSGALLVQPAAAARLDLPAVPLTFKAPGGNEIVIPSGDVARKAVIIGSTGNKLAVQKAAIVEDLGLGKVKFGHVSAIVMDIPFTEKMGPVDGLIGLPMFAEWLLTIDMPKRELRLSHGQLQPKPGQGRIRPDHLAEIPVVVGEGTPQAKAVLLMVDTGHSAGWLGLPGDAKSYPFPMELLKAEGVQGTNGEGEAASYRLKTRVRIGNAALADPEVIFVGQGKPAKGPQYAVIGTWLLSAYAITFDQKQGLVELGGAQIGR